MIAIETTIDQERLLELVQVGHARAAREHRPILVSHTARIMSTDLLPLFSGGRALGEDAFFWEQPSEGFALVGVGSAHQIECSGTGRFEQTARAWHALLDHAVIDGMDTLPGSGPTLLGGFAFDPQCPGTATWRGFPDAALLLPRLQLSVCAGAASLTCNVVVDETSDPPAIVDDLLGLYHATGAMSPLHASHTRTAPVLRIEECMPAADWKRLIQDTVVTIEQGGFEKVALARSLRVVVQRSIDVGLVLARLRGAYPAACTFAIARDDGCLVGATPERLVGVRSGVVRASGLAGTARRGATATEDDRLGQELLDSPKNRHEHAVVVEMLRAAFAELCVDTYAPAVPRLVKLSNLQHLYTPVSGRLRSPYTLLDLVARLHPTPAVGGLPRAATLDYIRAHEGLDRGWYAAPIGWLDARGEGDFAVALRSGLIRDDRAVLFAGVGIVQDSVPDDEYAETNLKFRPMLGALGVEQG